MNNILVNNKKNDIEEELISSSKTLNLEYDTEKSLYFKVENDTNTVLNIITTAPSISLEIDINENSNCTLNLVSINSEVKINANLLEENATFNLSSSIISSLDITNQIEVHHLASKTNSIMINHGYSINKANLILDVNAYIIKEANKCISNQDNQILKESPSISQINPNLYIDNYDVEASHSAYIGTYKEDSLFYLMSRGIEESKAKLLLREAFLFGHFMTEEAFKDRAKETLNNIIKEV